METQEQKTQPTTGDDLLLIQITSVENSLKNLLKAIASFGTPEQGLFVAKTWCELSAMRECQEDYMEVKSLGDK